MGVVVRVIARMMDVDTDRCGQVILVAVPVPFVGVPGLTVVQS